MKLSIEKSSFGVRKLVLNYLIFLHRSVVYGYTDLECRIIIFLVEVHSNYECACSYK